MTDMSDPYDVLAGIPKDLEALARKADQRAAEARIEAETYRQAAWKAEEARDNAEKWRETTPAGALVVDEAARERAYEALTHAWITDANPILDDEDGRRQMVALILDAAARPEPEADR